MSVDFGLYVEYGFGWLVGIGFWRVAGNSYDALLAFCGMPVLLGFGVGKSAFADGEVNFMGVGLSGFGVESAALGDRVCGGGRRREAEGGEAAAEGRVLFGLQLN